MKYHFWEELNLFKLCADQVIHRYIPNNEFKSIHQHCHDGDMGGHFSANKTAAKVLHLSFYWPTLFKDVREYVSHCDRCQPTCNISQQNEMPLNNILICEIFDLWGIDFMGPFSKSCGYENIVIVVDYVSKWVEALATETNDSKALLQFLMQNTFIHFGSSKAIISDGGKHFNNKQFQSLLRKYGVT